MPVPTLTLKVQLNDQVTKQLNNMSQNIFRWRDNVAKSGNTIINSLAKVFRELARIRTAFFILITFLGVRPIIRFFDTVIEASSKASLALASVNAKFEVFKHDLGDALAPFLVKFRELIIKIGVTLLSFLLPAFLKVSKFIIVSLDPVSKLIQQLGTIIISSIKIFVIGITHAGDLIKSVFADIFAFVLNDFAKTFEAMQKAIRDFINTTEIGSWAREFARLLEPFEEGFRMVGESLRDSAAGWTKTAVDASKEALALALPELLNIAYSLNLNFLKLSPETQKLANDLEESIKQVEKVLEEFKKKLEDPPSSTNWDQFFVGLEAGFKKHVKEMIVLAEEFGQALASSMETFVSDTFVTTMEGRFNKMRDVVVGFLNSIKRAIADFMAKKVVGDFLNLLISQGVLSGIRGLFTTGGGSGTPAIYDEFGNATPITSAQHGMVTKSEGLAYLHPEEAVIPLKNGKVPVQTTGMRTGNTVNVTFAPQVIDGPSFGQWLERNKDRIKKIMTEAASGGDMNVRQAFKLS